MDNVLNNSALRIKMNKVFYIIIAWMLIAFIVSLYEHIATNDTEFFSRTEKYDFINAMIANVLGAFLGGISGGSILVFYLKDRLKFYPLGLVILLSMLFYMTLIAFSLGLVSFLFNSNWLTINPLNTEVLMKVWESLTGSFHLKIQMTWLLVIAFTAFILQVSDKYGPGVLWEIIKGKYQKPIDETRIFMFLDIKASTFIAEKIGHRPYFELLNDFFADITNPILYTKGEIYQYVGDEIVISWKLKTGLKNANCIFCFFHILAEIERQKPKYIRKYGLVPEFKAGVHCGEITSGEIGQVKKDIVFTGDVLNTTSRIQKVCNDLNVKLLISGDLFEKLSQQPYFIPQEMGSIQLKGKENKIQLFTLELASKN